MSTCSQLTTTECPWLARIQSSSAPPSPVGSARIVNLCLALSLTIRCRVSMSHPLSFGRFICTANNLYQRSSPSRAQNSSEETTYKLFDAHEAIRTK